MSSNGGPHGDKWAYFPKGSQTGAEMADSLNGQADKGFTGQVIEIVCADGAFIFVSGYAKQN